MLKPLAFAILVVAKAGLQMPPEAALDNVSPVINDSGTIAFKIQSMMNGESGIVRIKDGAPSELAYLSRPETYLTDARLLENDTVSFSEYSEEHGALGAFSFDKKLNTLLSADDLFDFETISAPVLTSAGHFWKAGTRTSQKIFLNNDKFLAEGEKNISYLFTPDFNSKGEMAIKLRQGKRGELDESQPDIILAGEEVILKDHDADPTSPWMKFNNMVSINEKRDVATIATKADGSDCLLLNAEEKICEGTHDIRELEYFTPAINDHGSIAFRAIDSSGLRHIYLHKNNSLSIVVSEGQTIEDDKIISRPNFPSFAGNIDLNNKDEVVFHAVLEKSGDAILKSISPRCTGDARKGPR